MAFLNVAPLWTGGQSRDDTGLSCFSNQVFDSPKYYFLALCMGWKHTLSHSKRSGDLPRGTSLSEAFKQHKKTFPPFSCNKERGLGERTEIKRQAAMAKSGRRADVQLIKLSSLEVRGR